MGRLGLSTAITDSSEPNEVTIGVQYSGRLRVVLEGVGVIYDGEVKGSEELRGRP